MKIFLVSVSDNDHQKVKELLENIEEFKEWHLSIREQDHPVWFVALGKNRTAGWLAEKLGMQVQPNPVPGSEPNTGIVIEVADYHGYHYRDFLHQLDTWRDL